MKTAIYIESGRTQFVLTAESDIDKKVLEQLSTAKGLMTYRGSFYDCAGGYVRQSANFRSYDAFGERDDSLIFLVQETKTKEEML